MLAQQAEAMCFIVALLSYCAIRYLSTYAVGTPIGDDRLSDCGQSPAQREKLARTGAQSGRLEHMRAINRKTIVRSRLVLDDLKQDVTVLSELHGAHIYL